MTLNIEQKLNELADSLQQARTAEDEFKTAHADLYDRIAALKAELTPAILATGMTIKTNRLNAVYTPGRITWDTKFLTGYAAANPEILTGRKEGKPTVSYKLKEEE